MSKFITYDDPRIEPPIAHEEELKKEIQSLIHQVQSKNFSIHRHGFRGTHVKTQGIVKGTLTIAHNLTAELAQGLCSPANQRVNGGKKDVVLRYANEPSFLTDDRAPGPRGCGLKIFGVEGDFLDDVGQKTKTQDMTFNNAPVLELTDLPTTVEIFRIRTRHFLEPEAIPPELEKRNDKELQFAPTKLPNQHFVSYGMYSQSAYRWGKYVAKYALFPTGKLQLELAERAQITEQSDPEQHSRWLREYFAANDATYELRIQLCEDIDAQPVENCAVQWDEEKHPFRTVATLLFPKGQDCFSNQRRTFWEEKMKLNVWYGLEDMRPLGSVNRLRKRLYEESQEFRSELNAAKVVDVDCVDQIP